MEYGLEIKRENIPAHLDIETDIQKRQSGQVTFTVRINDGNIVDVNFVEYVDAKSKYLRLKSITVEEFTIASNSRK